MRLLRLAPSGRAFKTGGGGRREKDSIAPHPCMAFANPARFLQAGALADARSCWCRGLILVYGRGRLPGLPVQGPARAPPWARRCGSCSSTCPPPGLAWPGGSTIADRRPSWNWCGGILWRRLPARAAAAIPGAAFTAICLAHRFAVGAACLGDLVGVGRAD
jgi:hypothetical protein